MIYSALLLSIFIPIGLGILIFLLGLSKKLREIYCMAVVCAASALVFFCISKGSIDTITLIEITDRAAIAFRMDGLSRIFGFMLASLWPLTTLYAYEYMSLKEKENKFFALFTSCYGISLGICFSANLLTLFIFSEILTLTTFPLILQTGDKRMRLAAMKYISFAVVDAAAVFTGIMMVFTATGRFDFQAGGIAGILLGGPLVVAAYILMFFGFGVKAAILPFSSWLTSVVVAPTPVTALLNEVAIVNAGCFAVMRVSYYIYGAEYLFGSLPQKIGLVTAALTIVYGSLMAYRERIFKRRLAMSTVANLSYVLYGAMLFTPMGLMGAWMHMLYHGVMKINLFLVAGAAHYQAGADDIKDLKGLGRKMPVTFASFTIISVALIGVPPLCGFYSKYYLGFAGVQEGTLYSLIGVGALLISAFALAVSLMDVVIKAYFPGKDFDWSALEGVKDPGWKMTVPFIILSLLCIIPSLCQRQLFSLIYGSMSALF